MPSSLHDRDPKGSSELPEAERNPDQPGPARYETLDDGLLRLIGIPGFGIIIPNATGLFGTLGPGDGGYWAGYVWFIGLAAAIWPGSLAPTPN